MANLTEIRQSTVGSEELLYFIEVPDDLSKFDTKAFHMALLMAESNSMDSGVESDDPADVTSKVASHVITAYKKSFTHSGVYLKEDPVCKYEEYLFDNDVTDSKANCNIVVLKTYSAAGNEAIKYPAICEVSSFGGDAQDKINVEATYTIIGEGAKGTATFDKETGVATFTATSASKEL
jgi:hypothetical protein